MSFSLRGKKVFDLNCLKQNRFKSMYFLLHKVINMKKHFKNEFNDMHS